VALLQRKTCNESAISHHVSVRRIEDVPIAAGELRHKGQDRVSKQPNCRHGSGIIRIEKSVPLCEIRFAFDDGTNKQWQETWVHLAISINFRNDIDTVVQCSIDARNDGPSDALIGHMSKNAYSGIGIVSFDEITRLLWATIVDHVD